MREGSKIRIWLMRGALTVLAALGGAGLVFGGLVLGLVIRDPFGGGAHPSDAALLDQFHQKRPILDRLVAMIEEDPDLYRLGPDFTRPEDPVTAGVSQDRIALYRKLCLEAGILQGFRHSGGSIVFIVHARGLAIAGSSKGFAYREKGESDAQIVDGDLDAAVASLADKDVLLQRPIDGSWWLELDMR